MKVLHYKSNFLNASETFIKRLIEEHQQFKPAAMCTDRRELSPSCPVFEKPRHGMPGLMNALCFHLNLCLPFYVETIQKFKPDIIHAHFGFDGYRMIKPSQKTNVPLITSFYGSDVSRLPTEFDWKRRYRKLGHHADAFTAPSRHMKKQLIELGFPKAKIHIIPFGLDLKKFQFNLNYSPENKVMMVGRMVEKKGFNYALEALKLLKDAGQPFKLDLYGDGPLRLHLKKRSQQWGIEHLITFHGFQPVKKIRKAYHNHSILLVPSVTASDGDKEGIPNTLLEGMASGIPVIASRHSAIPEVVKHKHSGLLINEGDPEAIAEMIKSVKNEEFDLTALRKNARYYIENNHSVEQMAQKTEHIYCRVLNK